MQQRMRSSDILARLGGDEFGLLLMCCSLQQAQRLLVSLRTAIQAFRFTWQEKTFNLSASIGVVGIDSDSQGLATLLSAADSACYVAKSRGRNCVHVCEHDDVELNQQRGERQWVSQLTQALEEGRFYLYRQEIVPLGKHSNIVHSEILLRLRDAQGKVVLPSVFMPAAERYDLMPAIDRWVIYTFCSQYQQMLRLGEKLDYPALYNINLSAASINQDGLTNYIKSQLARYHVPPHQICFEITETTAISDFPHAVRVMQELKQLGCSFALDDFGSGMSSLSYLKTLPVDYLKIDGSFVKHLVRDSTDAAIVDCFNRLSHELGIQSIAECVEDKSTLQQLQVIGVDLAQGFGIAEPQRLFPALGPNQPTPRG